MTQPVCWPCWDLYMTGPAPVRLQAKAVRCCFCTTPTKTGLRILADAALVPFPEVAA